MVDFGRVAFGNLQLKPPDGAVGKVSVHLGEKLLDGRIDQQPPGSVRYNRSMVQLNGDQPLIVAPQADERNTRQPAAVLTPEAWGVVVPFRWVEIEGWPGELQPDQIVRRSAFATGWDDDESHFECSDEMLNRIWDLCKYSIKATTFAGIYVDGDRERIPYEADAYLNQLSHYATDDDIQMARDTFDWLMRRGTWPSEWAPHMVFMAHADWMRTGDRNWLASRYPALKQKTLLDRVGTDGLVHSNQQQQRWNDIVDWPKGERDGFVHTPVNTVVNAFHLAAMMKLQELAEALEKREEAEAMARHVSRSSAAFQKQLFNEQTGLYRDGVGTDHSSLHANLFPLAFGLVPDERQPKIVRFLEQRGMACSVYAAQYLLEGLFRHGNAEAALQLMMADGDRSWRHMVDSGTTITWEAWDQKYKPNQDWNHAWGAAPANLLPRFVLGVQPLQAGWRKALIHPRPGSLKFARGKVPTPQGPVFVSWEQGEQFEISITLPENMTARVELPNRPGSRGVTRDGENIDAARQGSVWIIEVPAGTSVLRLQSP